MVQKIQNKNEYLIIPIESDSRNLNHEVIYNTQTGEWSCECEDYIYRKRICKHIKKAYSILIDMGYEVKEELYTGEKVTFPIENKENKTSQNVEVVIEDLTQVQVLMELLNIKEQVLSIKENNTDDINEINNILKSVNKLIVSHS